MKELELKLKKEVEEGTHIVACRFPLPSLKPAATIGSGLDTVWLYRQQSTIEYSPKTESKVENLRN